MTHVVTQSCCNDASCVSVCPVNCIHPTSSETGFSAAEMLFIDPAVCIDCGACADICPVGAIVADYDLGDRDRTYLELNEAFFQSGIGNYVHRRPDHDLTKIDFGDAEPLRVAIVGSGPAGAFAAEYLLNTQGLNVEVDIFERLPVPWGLVRFGVAPDHAKTKEIADIFERTAEDSRFRLMLGIEIGREVFHADLQHAYHAIIYATGALADRKLGIAGESLLGSHSATEFAAWYNGHPDFADRHFNLDTERVVVVGNGNVALDVARILASDIEVLKRTDIADHALDALAYSRIREIVVIGRRGPSEAAFTIPELLGLAASDAFSLEVETLVDAGDSLPTTGSLEGWIRSRKLDALRQLSAQKPRPGRTLRLLFQRSPVEIIGSNSVSAIRLVRNRLERAGDGSVIALATDEEEQLDTGLVLRSVGYRGAPIEGLPFLDSGGTVPNRKGRVVESATGNRLPGTYVTGWIRRGPSGSMGSNRECAREVVTALLEDYREGRLATKRIVSKRLAAAWDASGGLQNWRAVDIHERMLGRLAKRPRVKLVDRDEIARIASGDPIG